MASVLPLATLSRSNHCRVNGGLSTFHWLTEAQAGSKCFSDCGLGAGLRKLRKAQRCLYIRQAKGDHTTDYFDDDEYDFRFMNHRVFVLPSVSGEEGSNDMLSVRARNIVRSLSSNVLQMPSTTAAAVQVTSEAAAGVLTTVTTEATERLSVAKQIASERINNSGASRTLERMRSTFNTTVSELPEGFWAKLLWLWETPPVKRIRVTAGMANLANLGIKLPALLVLITTQVHLLATQVSLPMLAPLLLGTGMVLRSVRTNATIIFPRLGVLVLLLWLIWFINSVLQNTILYLRRQGAVDQRLAGVVITASECCALLCAGVIILSMLGVNVPALLLPAGIAVAIAAKDLSHNFLAGFFLFAVRPFQLGDRVAVSFSSPALASGDPGSAWFEGVCEKVDLRYTVLRNGRRKLMVPNAAFLQREFMVIDEEEPPTAATNGSSPAATAAAVPNAPPPPATPTHYTPPTGDQLMPPFSHPIAQKDAAANTAPRHVVATQSEATQTQ